MDDKIIGYDDYMKDYESLALPDFKHMADQKLLQNVEAYEGEGAVQVNMEAAEAVDHVDHAFQFAVQLPYEQAKDGALMIYMGYI